MGVDMAKPSVLERLVAGSHVDPVTGCHVWDGARETTDFPYGVISVSVAGNPRRKYRIHRLIWQIYHGPIPPGMVIRHKVCDNPPCWEITHLAIGTHADNVADKIAKGRHHRPRPAWCQSGDHELSGDNLYIDTNGWYHCRACTRRYRKTRYTAGLGRRISRS